MGKWMKSVTLAAALLGTSGHVLAEQWAAKVNGVGITVQEVGAFNSLVAEKRGFKLKPGAATDELITRELLAQEGVRQGKDKNLDKTELARQVFKEYVEANAFGESDVKKEYERIKAEAPKKTEYKIRAIVVKTEDEATAILAGLNAGKPFSSFVSRSIDETSRNDNGNMGWFELHDLDPSFAAALVRLKPGTYQKTPVHLGLGYCVLLLDDVREGGFPEYSEVREQLIAKIRDERRNGLIQPLRDKANIERFAGYEAVKTIDSTKPFPGSTFR